MKLLVFTSTRADYGILRPLLALLDESGMVEMSLLVTGTHLSPHHGATVDEVEQDGYPIAARPPIISDLDGWLGTTTMLGYAVQELGRCVDELQPDAALVLGDRFEAFSFATVCHLARVPLVHLHGGELTLGATDDGFRHSITKFASLHLVAADEFRRRVIQLGESPPTVHTVGALGLDAIRLQLGPSIGPRSSTALVTYHPATRSDEDPRAAVVTIMDACLDAGMERLVVTRPNVDAGADIVDRALDRYATAPGVEIHESLGSQQYLRELAECRVVIGNSSSGIIEAPYLGTPTINVGSRQEGRPRSETVIDLADPSIADVMDAITRSESLIRPAFVPTVYGDGYAARRCATLIEELDLRSEAKHFHDLNPVHR